MTKVMKLRVTYEGYYGGSVDETVLLPVDVNGVLFDELQEKDYSEAVYLGEIAGKHSEEYGDLEVSFIDLTTIPVKEVTDLINKSDFNEFESLFEGWEDDFVEDEDEYDSEKVESLLVSYGITTKPRWEFTSAVYKQFIKNLAKEFVRKFRTITVLEEDYDEVIGLLTENNIRKFD